jgi:hypothetical protein
MNLVVREATKEDASLIAELTRAAWAGKVSVTSSGHRETAVIVAEHLRDGGGFVFESISNRRLGALAAAGCGAGRVGNLPHGRAAGYRGSNLSQHLLEAVIHHGLAAGVEEVRLAVRADQPKLIDFYTAYELAEELEYSHANPLEPAPLVMRRSLRH